MNVNRGNVYRRLGQRPFYPIEEETVVIPRKKSVVLPAAARFIAVLGTLAGPPGVCLTADALFARVHPGAGIAWIVYAGLAYVIGCLVAALESRSFRDLPVWCKVLAHAWMPFYALGWILWATARWVAVGGEDD